MKELKRLHVFLIASLFEKVRKDAYVKNTSMAEVVREALELYFTKKK